MIAVTKRTEPQSLQQYRLQEGAVYDGENFTPVKQDIRDQLVAEQGYLCAYCMGRIEPDDRNMKIEHWHSRKKYPAQQLNYTNLLGCCSGNEGQPDTHAHCDTKKRNADLLYNPAEPSHHSRLKIHYEFNGTIKSEDTLFDRQLNGILNLNYSRLMENRKAVWSSVTKTLSAIPGKVSRAHIEGLLLKWPQKNSEGKLPEYCGVAQYYLQKKLKRTP
ncbi:MAG: TIGR02646 family protein [Chlorobiaceae bacterium]|nr:TIGR02646 family protein [Chlorobiaceae bacterium]